MPINAGILKPLGHLIQVLRTLAAIVRADQGYYKIFAIGFNKTGTTSIHALLQQHGFLSLHNTRWRTSKFSLTYCAYQAFTDGPPHNFQRLDQRIPGCKFILNVRNLDEWLDSRLEHIRYTTSLGLHQDQEFWQISDAAVCYWIKLRNSHHLDVLKYFANRPEDLLILNFSRDPDAAKKISAFLGKPEIAHKPHMRPIPKARQAKVITNKARIDRCFNSLNIPVQERKNDLLCPSLINDQTINAFPEDTRRLAK